MRAPGRIFYFLYRTATSVQRRVSRRLTRPGLTMLGGVVVTGLLGLDIFGSVAYQAFLLLLCLLGTSLICSRRLRVRLTARRALPRFGTVGAPVSYHVRLSNHAGPGQKGLVLLEDLADSRLTYPQFVAVRQAARRRQRSFTRSLSLQGWASDPARIREGLVPALEPGQSVDVQLDLTPLRRGHVRFSGLTVARPDPLGLARASQRIPLPQSMLVLPRRYPLPHIALPGTMKYQPGGVAQASSVGESEEFVSLRDYRHGDPLRRIHWRSWARAGRPIVKEYQDEFFVRHALILDTFSDLAGNEVFEEAVSVAASFACTIQTQESLLDLLFVGAKAYCFTSGRGLAHTDQMLEILASVQICRDKSFQSLEELVLNHVGAVSGCVCVLVEWDAQRQELVRRLRMMGIPMKVLVITETDHAPLDPGPLGEEPQDFHHLKLGAISEGLARI
jgi:uncharacterized protein (DUF58 family)